MAYTTYIKNRSTTCVLANKTLDEVFWGKKLDVSHLQEFSVKVSVLRQDGQGLKLQKKSRSYIFTGFSEDCHTYRYDNPDTRAVYTS